MATAAHNATKLINLCHTAVPEGQINLNQTTGHSQEQLTFHAIAVRASTL